MAIRKGQRAQIEFQFHRLDVSFRAVSARCVKYEEAVGFGFERTLFHLQKRRQEKNHWLKRCAVEAHNQTQCEVTPTEILS